MWCWRSEKNQDSRLSTSYGQEPADHTQAGRVSEKKDFNHFDASFTCVFAESECKPHAKQKTFQTRDLSGFLICKMQDTNAIPRP